MLLLFSSYSKLLVFVLLSRISVPQQPVPLHGAANPNMEQGRSMFPATSQLCESDSPPTIEYDDFCAYFPADLLRMVTIDG